MGKLQPGAGPSAEGSILGEEGEVNLHRPAEAEADFQKARRIMRDLANKDATDSSARYFFALLNQSLGDIIRHRDPAQALALYEDGLAKLHEIKNGDDSMRRLEVRLLCGSSYSLRSLHRDRDAAQRIDAAFRILRETKDYPASKIIPASEADIVLLRLCRSIRRNGPGGQSPGDLPGAPFQEQGLQF